MDKANAYKIIKAIRSEAEIEQINKSIPLSDKSKASVSYKRIVDLTRVPYLKIEYKEMLLYFPAYLFNEWDDNKIAEEILEAFEE